MSDSNPMVRVTGAAWVDVLGTVSIVTGTNCLIQNVGSTFVYLSVKATTAPASTTVSDGVTQIAAKVGPGQMYELAADENELWALGEAENAVSYLAVQAK